jgi:hypothetical protein
VDRRYTRFGESLIGERAYVDGSIKRLANDLVDEDLKGLVRWLLKHVRYAELEAQNRDWPGLTHRLRSMGSRDGTRPLARAILKEVVFPSIPAKPFALFTYMYVMRLGLLDGLAGLRFCFYHAWYEVTVEALQVEMRLASTGERQVSRAVYGNIGKNGTKSTYGTRVMQWSGTAVLKITPVAWPQGVMRRRRADRLELRAGPQRPRENGPSSAKCCSGQNAGAQPEASLGRQAQTEH